MVGKPRLEEQRSCRRMRVENLRTIRKHCNGLEATVPLAIFNDLSGE
jgi:hypothetical protein